MNDKITALIENAEETGIITVLATFGNSIKVSIPLSEKFCDRSIDSMDLSVRASNGLKRIGAMTIRELTDKIMDESGLETVRNLGRKSISEIKTKLLNLAYIELTDREKQVFWKKFIEQNSECKIA